MSSAFKNLPDNTSICINNIRAHRSTHFHYISTR